MYRESNQSDISLGPNTSNRIQIQESTRTDELGIQTIKKEFSNDEGLWIFKAYDFLQQFKKYETFQQKEIVDEFINVIALAEYQSA
jgi:hypothetical protein